MKRQSLYLLLSALAFAGCQKNELFDINRSNEVTIKYAVALNQITKGTLLNTSGDNMTLAQFTDIVDSLTVKAFNADGVEKASQTVKWSESESQWVATPTAYWPLNTELSFLAYANLTAEQTATITSTGMSMSYTVPSSAEEQNDILFGYYLGDGGNTGTAVIRFKHPLAAIRFLIDEADESLVIKSISMEGVAHEGTVTMYQGGVNIWSNIDNYEHTVSQTSADDAGLPLSELEGYTAKLIGEPFLVIPQYTREHKVTVCLTFSDDFKVVGTIGDDLTGVNLISGDIQTFILKLKDGELIINPLEKYDGIKL